MYLDVCSSFNPQEKLDLASYFKTAKHDMLILIKSFFPSHLHPPLPAYTRGVTSAMTFPNNFCQVRSENFLLKNTCSLKNFLFYCSVLQAYIKFTK